MNPIPRTITITRRIHLTRIPQPNLILLIHIPNTLTILQPLPRIKVTTPLVHHYLRQLILLRHHIDMRLFLITVDYQHVGVCSGGQVTGDFVEFVVVVRSYFVGEA